MGGGIKLILNIQRDAGGVGQPADQGRMKLPRWNFYKHLINADGELVNWFASTTSPNSRKVIDAIEAHLPR